MLLWRNEADCDADRGSASEPAQQTAAATTTCPLPCHPLVYFPQTLFPLKFNVLFSLCPARTHIGWQRTLSLICVFDFRPFYSKNVNESSDGSSAAERQVNFHAHTHRRKMRALCRHKVETITENDTAMEHESALPLSLTLFCSASELWSLLRLCGTYL